MAGRGTIADFVTLQRGITYKGNLVGKPGPALLGLGSIHPGGGFREGDYKTYGGECPPKLMLFPGDLFVSLKGATKDGKMIGSVARVPPSVQSGRLTQDTVKLEFREKNPKTANFLYWILRTPQYRDYCHGRATGSAVVALSRDDFLNYPVPPVTKTRSGIVELLEELEYKIELNRRMNVTLETMARALFQSWFVDFDPVHAKMEGRVPFGIDPNTSALFPDSFQDSEVGQIPKGWEVKTFSELTTLITKGTTPTQDDMLGAPILDTQINYVRVNSINEDGSVLADKITAIPESVHAGILKRSILKKNDVLYTIAGTIGRVALAEDWFLPANTNQAVAVIRPELDVPSGFLILTMRHEVFREELHNNIVHAVQANLSLGTLSKARTVIPPKSMLQQMFKQINEALSKINANRAKSRTLATLRDTLLSKLLSGEITPGI
jgi:restriction endonuclease S subunit